MNVLIVDDQEENLYLLEALFRGNGHDVHLASNGAEAHERLKSGGVDLVISDILMPVMDGFELCRKIRTDEALRHIPFIIYTATYTGPQDEEFAIKIGADRFIQKPCEPDAFMEAVQEVVGGARRSDVDVSAAPHEEEVLKLYNERLVRNLEQKMQQLEKETRMLRETEKALRISEGKYRRLHESMTDGFVYVDMNGFIRESNKSFQNMLGYNSEELSRLTYLDLTPEKWRAYEQDIVTNQVLGKGYSEVYEKEYWKKDGTVFPAELRTFLIRNDAGEKEGMWAIVRDITERKQAEKAQKELEDKLHQAQKMESVGRLAGGIAHDFNNLLAVILGYGEILLGALDKNHPHYKPLDQICQAGVRARDLTRQLLAFSRKQILEMKVVNINQVVTGFEKLLLRLIGEDIHLALSLASMPLPAKADTAQLEQLLMNLAVNARDAMPEGGTLTIETASVELDRTYTEIKPGVLPGRYAMICVSDTGCGMDKQTLDRIFEPFFTTKDSDKGTGLGLATCYGIVKQHGGNIWVYSEPGEGTVFKIYLPLSSEEPVNETLPAIELTEERNSATVLVLEDELSVRNLVGEILTEHGYKTIESGGASEAIAKAAAHSNPIHLVITDVIMPEMKGPEAFEKIREHHPEAKVLYMSGYTDNVVACQGILKEDIEFIQKPFTVKGLLQKCHSILQAG